MLLSYRHYLIVPWFNKIIFSLTLTLLFWVWYQLKISLLTMKLSDSSLSFILHIQPILPSLPIYLKTYLTSMFLPASRHLGSCSYLFRSWLQYILVCSRFLPFGFYSFFYSRYLSQCCLIYIPKSRDLVIYLFCLEIHK